MPAGGYRHPPPPRLCSARAATGFVAIRGAIGARAQRGVFNRADLRARGTGASRATPWVRAGHCEPLHSAVYSMNCVSVLPGAEAWPVRSSMNDRS